MHSQRIFGAVLGLAVNFFTPHISAGSVTVYSDCNYAVSCALVNGVDPHIVNPPPPPGPDFSSVGSGGFHVDDFMPNIGQGIHCGRSDNLAQPTLLEWTYNTTDAAVWWDASLVDGDPFHNEGFGVWVENFPQPPTGQPSPFDRCWSVDCPTGGCDITQVYHNAEDDRSKGDNPMRACPPDTVLVWEICRTT